MKRTIFLIICVLCIISVLAVDLIFDDQDYDHRYSALNISNLSSSRSFVNAFNYNRSNISNDFIESSADVVFINDTFFSKDVYGITPSTGVIRNFYDAGGSSSNPLPRNTTISKDIYLEYVYSLTNTSSSKHVWNEIYVEWVRLFDNTPNNPTATRIMEIDGKGISFYNSPLTDVLFGINDQSPQTQDSRLLVNNDLHDHIAIKAIRPNNGTKDFMQFKDNNGIIWARIDNNGTYIKNTNGSNDSSAMRILNPGSGDFFNISPLGDTFGQNASFDFLTVRSNATVQGNIISENNITVNDSFLIGDSNHILTLGMPAPFTDISNSTIVFQDNGMKESGQIIYCILQGNNTLFCLQSGRNNSAQIEGNSGLRIPNNLASDPFFNFNMSKLSNCLTVYDFFNVTPRIFCDTSGYGASEIIQGGAHIFRELFIGGRPGFSSGIRSEGTANYLMDGNDFNINNGSLHIQTPTTFASGFEPGDIINLLNVNFEGSISPFANNQTDIGDWISLTSASCDSSDCARSSGAGNGDVSMITNFNTLNANESNLTFVYSLTNLIGAGLFSVIINNATDSELLFSDGTDNVALSAQTINVNSVWDNQSDVNLTFKCNYGSTNKPTRLCFVDTVKYTGLFTANTTAIISGSYSKLCFAADDNCDRGFIYNATQDTIFVRGTLNFTGTGGGITGSGSTNNIAKWASASSLTNANIVDDGNLLRLQLPTNVTGGFNTSGDVKILGNITGNALHLTTDTNPIILNSDGAIIATIDLNPLQVASSVYTLPIFTTTLAGTDLFQTWTTKQIFPNIDTNNISADGNINASGNLTGANLHLVAGGDIVFGAGITTTTLMTSSSLGNNFIELPSISANLSGRELTETIDGTKTYTADNTYEGNNTYEGQEINSPSFQTLSSDSITYQSKYMILDTEGAASNDNLTTINGGTAGAIIIIQTTVGSRDIEVLDTDNIDLGTSSRTLNRERDKLMLIFDPQQTKWSEISFSNN